MVHNSSYVQRKQTGKFNLYDFLYVPIIFKFYLFTYVRFIDNLRGCIEGGRWGCICGHKFFHKSLPCYTLHYFSKTDNNVTYKYN